MLIAGVDKVAQPVIDKFLGERTGFHVGLHVNVGHFKALVLQHALYGDDVGMYLTPRQWLDGGVNDVGAIVAHFQDGGHRQTWARVAVILYDDVRVLVFDGLSQLAKHGGLAKDSLTMARAEYSMGRLLHNEGRKEEALSVFNVSINYVGNCFLERAAGENGLAVSYMMFHQFDSAGMLLQKSLHDAQNGGSEKMERKALLICNNGASGLRTI